MNIVKKILFLEFILYENIYLITSFNNFFETLEHDEAIMYTKVRLVNFPKKSAFAGNNYFGANLVQHRGISDLVNDFKNFLEINLDQSK